MFSKITTLSAVLTLSLLLACGGGDETPTPEPAPEETPAPDLRGALERRTAIALVALASVADRRAWQDPEPWLSEPQLARL